MYDRFTDRARKVMALARKEAHRFKHDFIGTEHILLGLIEERSGVAAHVLRGLGVEIDRVRSEIEKNVPFGPSEVTRGQLPFTPRAKKVLELSMKEADELRHNYLGTEHLLLGLLRENGGVGALVLRDLGLELEEVRYGVLEVLGAGSGGATKPASLWGTNAAVVALAGEEALRAGQGFVGTGHLLLALLADERGNVGEETIRAGVSSTSGEELEIYHSDIKKIKEQRIRELAPVLNNSARRILESLGAGAERVRGEKEKLARYDLASLAEEALGLSPLVSNVLQRAMRLALQLGQQSPDSRHLLLAFVAREDSYEARILAQLGLDLGQARRRACEALGVDPEKAQRVLEGSEALGEKEGLLRKILRKFTRPDDP